MELERSASESGTVGSESANVGLPYFNKKDFTFENSKGLNKNGTFGKM
jgi:hypothetical protein